MMTRSGEAVPRADVVLVDTPPALQTARFFEELYEGVPMQDPAAFLTRYAAEFRLAAG